MYFSYASLDITRDSINFRSQGNEDPRGVAKNNNLNYGVLDSKLKHNTKEKTGFLKTKYLFGVNLCFCQSILNTKEDADRQDVSDLFFEY